MVVTRLTTAGVTVAVADRSKTVLADLTRTAIPADIHARNRLGVGRETCSLNTTSTRQLSGTLVSLDGTTTRLSRFIFGKIPLRRLLVTTIWAICPQSSKRTVTTTWITAAQRE